MPYTSNPHLPKLRMEAVKLVRKGWGVRQVARHTGFQPSTISRWIRRAPEDARSVIPTESSRPRHHPRQLPQTTINRIVALRLQHKRCAEVIHYLLKQEDIVVSLRSVKRVLKRKGLTKERGHLRKNRISPRRPLAAAPGDLVQMDTIHIHTFTGEIFYVYTLLDVHSRWAWAKVSQRMTAGCTLRFLAEARHMAPFPFRMLQSDHGPEFSRWFTRHAKTVHRFSRVRRPNDNAHLERFNRTIQEECLYYVKQHPKMYQAAISKYLPFYNNERPHLALNMLSPSRCCEAIV